MGRVKTSHDNVQILVKPETGNENVRQIQEAEAMKQIKLVFQLFTMQ